MKIKYYFFLFWSVFLSAQVQNGTWTVIPNPFNEDEEIEVKVSGINPSSWGVEDVYLWTWYFDSNDVEVNSNINWNGEWNNSKESMKMIKNQDGSFSFKFKPTELYQDNGIGRKAAAKFIHQSGRLQAHRSMGTMITENRLELLHHARENKIYVETIDLFDKKTGFATGTKVLVQIPVVEVQIK